MTELDDAVVLVLGASGGLGSRVAALLAEHGAVVVRGGSPGGGLTGEGAYLADLREASGAGSLVQAALAAHGRLDGVVVAAGAVAFGPASTVADDTLDELFAINALAPIRVIRDSFAPLAASAEAGRKPFVITLSGVVSEAPTSGMAAYSAAKSAIAAFVQATSREYRRSGIRLLDARPGHTETDLSKHPIAGEAPAFGAGHSPDAVAERIVRAIVDEEKDLPSTAF
jgi:NAD(P)-dependent dehydrogenase (short-subunit alcohol dehydrogenase family)